jgi:GNAT superfamily N-acetyltransferase
MEITEAKSKRDIKDFIDFHFYIYRNDPYWVPPLKFERMQFFNPKKNPFYKHADIALFIAKKDGKSAGTIAAIVNHNHNKFYKEKVGFFGCFEVIENYEVAKMLFDKVKDWLKEKNMNTIRGPMNFSTNDECGLLIDGFESPPVCMMTYNPKYYIDFIEKYGFKKTMDLYAYFISLEELRKKAKKVPEKLISVVNKIKKRNNLIIRNIDMKKFDEEVERFKKIYNSAWEKNWGFVPMTNEEIEHLADGLRKFLDPDLIFIAEIDDSPVGFSLTLPDINQPLLKIKGKLLPFGWIKYLWYKRRIDICRVFAMGVLKKYRRLGINALMHYKTSKKLLSKGYKLAEMSWILENNVMTNREIQTMGGKIYKTYRIYDFKID